MRSSRGATGAPWRHNHTVVPTRWVCMDSASVCHLLVPNAFAVPLASIIRVPPVPAVLDLMSDQAPVLETRKK